MFDMNGRMERKKKERRETILNTAEFLIAKEGFKSMTMDEVALKADVAKGTLYLYFKNKSTLCAAVNARINKQLNEFIKEKMDLYQTGSERILASGTAVIEFSQQNPQKWKAGTELLQLKYKDMEDPNVQESLNEANKIVHLLADAYQQGINEGTIYSDLDPVSTAIYNRMAINNVFTPTSEQKSLLELNKISQDHYLSISWNLINRSIHVKSSIREETEIPAKDRRSNEDIAKEIKGIVDSLGLPSEEILDICNAWELISKITMGNFKYKILKSNDDYVLFQVTDCPILNSIKDTDVPSSDLADGCRNYSLTMVQTLNPKYTQYFTKMKCDGDECCEGIVELKKALKSSSK